MKEFHYVYCIENLINKKVYVGKHSTDDMNDGYMGSGKLISRAIKKYSLENFRKYILVICESEEQACFFEKEIVNEEFVKDKNTYNLVLGGRGSWYRANQLFTSEDRRRNGSIGGKIFSNKIKSDPIMKELFSEKITKSLISRWKNETYREKHRLDRIWTGKRHTEEAKRKIGKANSVHQTGQGNSQFGTVWINNPLLKMSKKVKKDELESWLEKGWIKGRRCKW
jgi:hypothetical protein